MDHLGLIFFFFFDNNRCLPNAAYFTDKVRIRRFVFFYDEFTKSPSVVMTSRQCNDDVCLAAFFVCPEQGPFWK